MEEQEERREAQVQPEVRDEPEVKVKIDEMPEDMSKDAIEWGKRAFHKYQGVKPEHAMATLMKDQFDTSYYPEWHCVVGKRFGSYVTHEEGHFIYFYVGPFAFLLFKKG